MRHIEKPAFDVTAVLTACRESITDVGLNQRLGMIGGDLSLAEHQYDERGRGVALHTIPGSEGVSGNVRTDEMGRVYKNTFAKSRRTRHIYDSIKKSTVNDICPLCGQRTISTLDHYLPWTTHPSLAITPINLVPACADCNKAKGAYCAGEAGDQLLHPYFDNLDQIQWIFAEVVEVSPSALLFSARPPTDWHEVWRRRVTIHFEKYGLGKLYGAHAAEELANIRHSLEALGSGDRVRAFLESQRQSRAAAHVNSWNTAAYQAWGSSPWFCEGGYRA